jgi:SET domain-containing protein
MENLHDGGRQPHLSAKKWDEIHEDAAGVQGCKVEVKPSLGRGRGVFAIQPISCDELIESCPIIRFEPQHRAALAATPLHKYLYGWSDDGSEVAIPLGYGSLYNHSDEPNASYHRNRSRNAIDFIATKCIAIGEEITISYLNSFDSPKKLCFRAV